jgi:hypothetical protein
MGRVSAKADSGIDYPQVINFEVDSIAPAPPDIFAVYDEGEAEYAVFPVILFATGTITRRVSAKHKEDAPNTVCGMVSNIGGLVMVEHAVDMKFVGYWRKNCQPWDEFLEDHELEAPPSLDDDDESEYEDESELNR